MTNDKRRKWLRLGILVALSGAAAGTALGGTTTCPFATGWMTGGGSIFETDDTAVYAGQFDTSGRITHGFVLHCTPKNSDNLEVNDHATGQSFHLDAVTSVECSDDPTISPNPPDANFDTMVGTGTGSCKQPDRPCTVSYTLTDGGEVGGCVHDTASIVVSDANGVVFSVSGDVDCGNQQAHSK